MPSILCSPLVRVADAETLCRQVIVELNTVTIVVNATNDEDVSLCGAAQLSSVVASSPPTSLMSTLVMFRSDPVLFDACSLANVISVTSSAHDGIVNVSSPTVVRVVVGV